jgi:predicted DNA-binding transcriptional regulator AlpA
MQKHIPGRKPSADQGSTDPRRFMTTQQCAEYLGLSASTLTKWRMVGRGPRFFNFGSLVRYAVEDADAYVASCRVEPRSDTAA